MKVLALIFVALVLSSTLAIQARSPSLATKKKVDSMLHNKRSWSSIIVNLALLQAKAGNPVAELVAAIEKIIVDLDSKTERATADFDQRTGEHQNEVKRLQREIDNANADVANSDAFLKEVLRPMKLSLENDIARLQADIAKTKVFLEEAAIQRDREHNDYVTKIADIDGGLAAIKEAFGLLQTLMEGGSSFAQISKAKSHLAKLQSALSKSIDAAIVRALVQVATSSEFTDQGLLRKLMDMLHNVEVALQESQKKLTADEELAQVDYTKLVADKETEIKQFESETIDKRAQLESTDKKIAATEAFIVARQYDSVQFNKELVSENQSYEDYVKFYNDLMVEFAKEQAACREALEILNGAEFAGYISDRMQQDKVIGTNQGSGVSVN